MKKSHFLYNVKSIADINIKNSISITLQTIFVFLEMNVCVLVSNFQISCISVSDFYISSCSKVGGLIVEIYKPLTDQPECKNWERGCAVSFLGVVVDDLNIMLIRILIILIRMRHWSFFIVEYVLRLRRKITAGYPYAVQWIFLKIFSL